MVVFVVHHLLLVDIYQKIVEEKFGIKLWSRVDKHFLRGNECPREWEVVVHAMLFHGLECISRYAEENGLLSHDS